MRDIHSRELKLPPVVGQKDFMIFLRFLDNRKQYTDYMKKLDDRIERFEAASSLYGKAAEIEKTHASAKLWEQRAEYDYGERGKKTESDEAALVVSTQKSRAKIADAEKATEEALGDKRNELSKLKVVLDGREIAVGKRENAIVAREARADKKYDAAMETKRAADKLLERLQDATRQVQEAAKQA